VPNIWRKHRRYAPLHQRFCLTQISLDAPIIFNRLLQQLPSGWEEYVDPQSGDTVYANEALGITQWDRPVAAHVAHPNPPCEKNSPSSSSASTSMAPASATAPCVSHRSSSVAESKRPSLTPAPLAPVYPSHSEGKRPSLVRGGGYGLDVAIAEKIAAKYDADSEAKMIAWISAVTRLQPRSDETFAEWLKNG